MAAAQDGPWRRPQRNATLRPREVARWPMAPPVQSLPRRSPARATGLARDGGLGTAPAVFRRCFSRLQTGRARSGAIKGLDDAPTSGHVPTSVGQPLRQPPCGASLPRTLLARSSHAASHTRRFLLAPGTPRWMRPGWLAMMTTLTRGDSWWPREPPSAGTGEAMRDLTTRAWPCKGLCRAGLGSQKRLACRYGLPGIAMRI